MTQRNRPMTPRKTRVWNSWGAALSLTASGSAGQQSDTAPGASFLSRTGRNFLKSDTLAHTWVKGMWFSNAAGDGTSLTCLFGIGFFPSLIDDGDFPPLTAHPGELPVHDTRALLENTVAKTSLNTPQLATIDIESGGQRSSPSSGTSFQMFVYAETIETPSTATTLLIAVTQLWLVAS